MKEKEENIEDFEALKKVSQALPKVVIKEGNELSVVNIDKENKALRRKVAKLEKTHKQHQNIIDKMQRDLKKVIKSNKDLNATLQVMNGSRSR